MTPEEKLSAVRYQKSRANEAKSRLMDIASALEDIGAIRDAKSLKTLIWKLECWQHR